jgi:GTP-binding protein
MVIALAGRPNVGKSSLFNRFVGRRRSLVWDRPGVTRDLIRGEWKFSDDHDSIEVWDLAGVGREGLSIQNLPQETVKKIDLILLVVDGSEPLTSEDLECAKAIRKFSKPIMVAVNKSDKKTFAEHSTEISRLFPNAIFPISAETKSGLGELEEKLIRLLKVERRVEPVKEESTTRVLIMGKPNVGKSSLMNALSGERISFVSERAGTTRDVIQHAVIHKGRSWSFTDTAGIRKKAKVYGRKADPVEIFSVSKSFQELKRSDLALFVIEATSDATLSSQDRKLLHLIRSSLVPTVILVNKWDLIRKDCDEETYRKKLKYQLGDLYFLPLLFVSAKTGFRLEKVFQMLVNLEKSIRVIPTPKLNKWLRSTVEARPPRVAKRGQKGPQGRTPTQYLHFLYMVQTSRRPMAFQLFCNAPHAVAEDDKRFLSNHLRNEFGLTGVPLKLLFRKKTS